MSTTPPAAASTRWNGFWGRYVISLALASAFVVTGVALVNRGIDDRVKQIHRIAGLDVAPAPPGGANYLIIGSDTRAFVTSPGEASSFGSPDEANAEGQRSDTLMVAHVEPGPQKTFVVSFPRDLMVDVPGLPGKNRINAAYANGGPQAVIDTLKENFGIDVNHYLEVDFKSFQAIVDTIGNVHVYLPGRTRDEETGLNTPYGGGCYPLNGAAALAYVRSRNLEISDPSGNIVDPDTGEHWRLLDQRADLDRIARQQAFIRKLAGLAISKSLSDPFLAVDLADNVLGYVKADPGLSRDDVNALVRAFRTVDVNDTSAIQFETLPVDPDPDNPNVTLVPAAAAAQIVDQLRTFGDNAPKASAVQPSQVKVRVTDATRTDVGRSVASRLSEIGFQASAAAPAKVTIPISEIHYGYDQAEEAKALLPYFPDAKLVPDPKANDALVLVLGSSFPGTITVPSTTTTAPASTVPGAPVTTAPSTTTTTIAPAPTDPCP